MNRKSIVYAALIFIIGCASNAQAQKQHFTMAEAVNGMAGKLAIATMKQLQWAGSSEYYSYVVNNDTEKKVWIVNPENFIPNELTNLDQLNKALDKKGVKKLAAIPSLSFLTANTFYFTTDNKVVECNVTGDKLNITNLTKLPEDADPTAIDTSTMNLAYLSNNNLFVHSNHEKAVQITNDGSKDIVYGKAVHRDEFGIDRGLFWSPSGRHLAFYRMDQGMVEDYPVVNWDSVPATVKFVKYPFAGRTSHEVTLGVYDTKTKSTVYLKTGTPKDQYLTTVTWSPDEKYIYVSLLNRDQNHLWMNRYDAHTGELVKTLFEEKNDKYVEPQHPLYFPTDDPNRFIWWSQRDGYMHLYLYVNDKEAGQLTSGNWVVNEILGYNTKANEIIFTSSKESPMQKNVYGVKLDTKEMRRFSTSFATHTAQLSHSGVWLIDNFTSREIPRAIDVCNLYTKDEKRILTSVNTVLNYHTARTEQINLHAEDGTVLYGKLIYPIDFDSTKKYPTIVYLYNGPHVQLNKESFPFSGNLWYDYMAQHGYFMFVMDGRGSSNRGFGFESVTHRQLGTVEMDDQLVGVKFLKALPFVDTNRMGVYGWSFGGFMTTSLMLRHPGVFKCAVAGGPVMDWSMYEVMYTERYMDTPQQNPEGYKANVLFDKVKNLQGKLLVIHGASDETVVWEHSMKFIKKSVDEGVQVDYYVYPGHAHNVRGKDRVHLMQKITDYFDVNLK